MGVSAGEVGEVELRAFADPVSENEAHAYIDFEGLTVGDTQRRAKLLVRRAVERDRFTW